jgi:hypothetical protein
MADEPLGPRKEGEDKIHDGPKQATMNCVPNHCGAKAKDGV